MWLVGPQGRSVRVRKMSPTRGFDSWTVHPVASRYTDWVILVRCSQYLIDRYNNLFANYNPQLKSENGKVRNMKTASFLCDTVWTGTAQQCTYMAWEIWRLCPFYVTPCELVQHNNVPTRREKYENCVLFMWHRVNWYSTKMYLLGVKSMKTVSFLCDTVWTGTAHQCTYTSSHPVRYLNL